MKLWLTLYQRFAGIKVAFGKQFGWMKNTIVFDQFAEWAEQLVTTFVLRNRRRRTLPLKIFKQLQNCDKDNDAKNLNQKQ